MDLSQAKHAFITGGASGIGLGIADALAKRGVPVTIVDVDAETVKAVVAARNGKLRGQVLDVRDREAWVKVKAEAEAALGPVDVLVLNAGIGPEGEELVDANPEAFERLMAVNVGGIFNGIQAFGRDMRERRRGHIVITGSMTGLAAARVPRIGTYTASKFAGVALGDVLRGEMAAYDVVVSTLCPGQVTSNLGRNTMKMGNRTRELDYKPDPAKTPATRKAGMDPAEVGEITARGIERDQAYIITHPEGWSDIESRMAALKAAFEAAS